MSPLQQDPRDLISYVVRHMACDQCSCAYRPNDIDVVYHRDDQWVLQALCTACGSTQPVEAFDELPYKQPWRSRHIKPSAISEDDVRRWHEYLTSFQGDLFDLLIS